MLKLWYHDSESFNVSLRHGGIRMLTMDPSALLLAPDVSALHGGVTYLSDINRRLAPYFERGEPRQWALAYLGDVESSRAQKTAGNRRISVAIPRPMPFCIYCAGPCESQRPSAGHCIAVSSSIWGSRRLCWSSMRSGSPIRTATRLASRANTAGRWAR
jgi:hypothetical protein